MAKMFDDIGPRLADGWSCSWMRYTRTRSRSATCTTPATPVPASLDALRDRLLEVDVEPYVEQWLHSVRGRVVPDTIKHYRKHVRTFIQVGKRLPQLTPPPWRTAALAGRRTRQVGYQAQVPCGDVAILPVPGRPWRFSRPTRCGVPGRRHTAGPRAEHLEHPDVMRLVDAHGEAIPDAVRNHPWHRARRCRSRWG